jgi:hypothetical protein
MTAHAAGSIAASQLFVLERDPDPSPFTIGGLQPADGEPLSPKRKEIHKTSVIVGGGTAGDVNHALKTMPL